MSAMIRSTNHLRQKRRPKHPKDLKFKWIQEELLTNFTVKDVFVKIKETTACHTVMFTAALLSLLSKARPGTSTEHPVSSAVVHSCIHETK